MAQSIACTFAAGEGAGVESDPLVSGAATGEAVASPEQAVLALLQGVVLRYGYFCGPGTRPPQGPSRPSAMHVDAALRAPTQDKRGIHTLAEDNSGVSSERARRELGFDPAFRTAR